MAERRECFEIRRPDGSVYQVEHSPLRNYADSNKGLTVHRMVELHPWEDIVTREQAAQYAGFRHVEPDCRVLTAKENAAVLRLIDVVGRWRRSENEPGEVGAAHDALPASLLEAAKETR